jgi:hypothetical protein
MALFTGKWGAEGMSVCLSMYVCQVDILAKVVAEGPVEAELNGKSVADDPTKASLQGGCHHPNTWVDRPGEGGARREGTDPSEGG